jgi:NAD(P)-dependent dehydrogenase (short-subunit alcohol dehydrogenase family)
MSGAVPEPRVAIVSGANRGVGLGVVEQLAAAGHTVVLGSRDEAAGAAARTSLGELVKAVHVVQLDITQPDSIAAAAGWVERELGGADVLVNNAGVLLDSGILGAEADLELVQRSIETNLYGGWRLAMALLPGMRAQRWGRIVNLSSAMAQLTEMHGGTTPGYRVSKTGVNVLTRMLADELREDRILVNACCPGWAKTEMGGPDATREIAEAADTPVWLATLPDDGPSGGLFRDRQPITW